MSAIAGIWRFDGKPGAASDCARMLSTQEIYGPDDGRQWANGTIAMGRRLFRSLPEDIYDRQPLESEDRRLVLVADVRLDNREELTAALGWPQARAAEACDAAILLGCLERWEEGALDRLAGEFAFALWDTQRQRLLLARDFLGQRPLYYHRGKNFFAFSSMAKGLHALPEIPYAPDEQVMEEFIILMPQWGPRTFFKDIDRVESDHFVSITRDGISATRYWNPRGPSGARASTQDYVEGVRHHVDQATRACLRGGGGAVAAHLSGGFDSSAVTATAARLLAPEGGRVTAFTALPREDYDTPVAGKIPGDAGPHAAATAAMYPNIEHVLLRTGHLSPVAELDKLYFLFERPILNLCNSVWWRAINNSAQARGLKIVLYGTMGNMSFSYTGDELLPELLLSGRLMQLAKVARELKAARQRTYMGVLKTTLGPFMPVWLWRTIRRAVGRPALDPLIYTAIRPERLSALDALARERSLDVTYRPWKNGFDMRVWGMQRVDQGNYNKAAVAGWGVDQRDPTADKRLVEYCLRVPTEEYLADGQRRALAKRAFADRLPRAVLEEHRTGRQAPDWHEGLTAGRGEISAELEQLARCAPAGKSLDLERLQRLVQNWPASSWEDWTVMLEYRCALLRGVSAGHFLRKASGSN